jgi:hypothetical protein
MPTTLEHESPYKVAGHVARWPLDGTFTQAFTKIGSGCARIALSHSVRIDGNSVSWADR